VVVISYPGTGRGGLWRKLSQPEVVRLAESSPIQPIREWLLTRGDVARRSQCRLVSRRRTSVPLAGTAQKNEMSRNEVLEMRTGLRIRFALSCRSPLISLCPDCPNWPDHRFVITSQVQQTQTYQSWGTPQGSTLQLVKATQNWISACSARNSL